MEEKRNETMDEKKIMEAMKGIYDSLSDEQKKRADKVDSKEAFMKFVEEENIELPDELVEMVAGGWDLVKAHPEDPWGWLKFWKW